MHRITIVSLVLAVLTSIGAARQVAGGSGHEDATALFATLWTEAQRRLPPTGFAYEFRSTQYATRSAQEIAEWEQRLALTPDHPEHAALRIERYRVERGPDIIEYQVWWMGPDSFRLCQTQPRSDPAARYQDTTITSRAVWQLGSTASGGQLAVLEPGAPFPAERAYFGATGSSAGAWLSRFTSGSFSALTLANGAPAGAEWSGENLIGRIRLPSGFIVRVSGILGTGSPAYRVRELSSTPPDARVPTLRLRFHDWIPEPALDGALVARRVERLDAEGRVVELLELTSVRPINNEEFERVTAIPAHDGEDPIRGASTYTSIFDYRPGAHTFTSISADGTTTTIPLATAREGWPGMRALGWIVAAIMVACLLWVRIHRARRLTSAAYGRPSPE